MRTNQSGQDSRISVRDFQNDQADRWQYLSQNQLLDGQALYRWLRDRGIEVWRDDPAFLWQKGLLPADGKRGDGEPLFHPFRIYPFYWILSAADLAIVPSSALRSNDFSRFVGDCAERILERLKSVDRIAEEANAIVDLPIMLEPAYWPEITGRTRMPAFHQEERYRSELDAYREALEVLLGSLDVDKWAKMHERLRFHAAGLDNNHQLYLLLRLAPWDKRNRLRGRISAALWIRHVAEVLRRAFEECRGVEWPEEDQGIGQWVSGARVRQYGSERPLDNPVASMPHVAFNFGLHTGSVVRWYVEGDTELGAISECLPGASLGGIELINLRGSLENKPGVALKLSDNLVQDRELRRFSIISFDLDEPDTVRTIRQQVKLGRIVGFLAPHDPDFEFANFELSELIEVAARFDEARGFSGESIRSGDWSSVRSSREFERRYRKHSERHQSLKGQEWGIALARYAFEHPTDSTGRQRPLLKSVDMALRSRLVRYDYQAAAFTIDPETFELIRVPEPEDPWRP